jgi:GTP-binding protein HflX
MVFNKIDAYSFVEKEEDDLTPLSKENLTLEEMMNTWLAKENQPCIFISAKNKTNLHQFRQMLYDNIKTTHAQRFPFNEFLFEVED